MSKSAWSSYRARNNAEGIKGQFSIYDSFLFAMKNALTLSLDLSDVAISFDATILIKAEVDQCEPGMRCSGGSPSPEFLVVTVCFF